MAGRVDPRRQRACRSSRDDVMPQRWEFCEITEEERRGFATMLLLFKARDNVVVENCNVNVSVSR